MHGIREVLTRAARSAPDEVGSFRTCRLRHLVGDGEAASQKVNQTVALLVEEPPRQPVIERTEERSTGHDLDDLGKLN